MLYISIFGKEPKDVPCFSIIRVPKPHYPNIVALAPSSELLSLFKRKNISEDEFKERFMSELVGNPATLQAIIFIANSLDTSDICLVCYSSIHQMVVSKLFNDVGILTECKG